MDCEGGYTAVEDLESVVRDLAMELDNPSTRIA